MQTKNKILLTSAIAYSAFGHIAAIFSQGMKGPNGPILVAVFIFTLMAMDVALIKGRFSLKQVNAINLVSIVTFYFFSIALPLLSACPSLLSAIVALLGFSLVTFLSFALIAYLIRRVLDKALNYRTEIASHEVNKHLFNYSSLRNPFSNLVRTRKK